MSPASEFTWLGRGEGWVCKLRVSLYKMCTFMTSFSSHYSTIVGPGHGPLCIGPLVLGEQELCCIDFIKFSPDGTVLWTIKIERKNRIQDVGKGGKVTRCSRTKRNIMSIRV